MRSSSDPELEDTVHRLLSAQFMCGSFLLCLDGGVAAGVVFTAFGICAIIYTIHLVLEVRNNRN